MSPALAAAAAGAAAATAAAAASPRPTLGAVICCCRAGLRCVGAHQGGRARVLVQGGQLAGQRLRRQPTARRTSAQPAATRAPAHCTCAARLWVQWRQGYRAGTWGLSATSLSSRCGPSVKPVWLAAHPRQLCCARSATLTLIQMPVGMLGAWEQPHHRHAVVRVQAMPTFCTQPADTAMVAQVSMKDEAL